MIENVDEKLEAKYHANGLRNYYEREESFSKNSIFNKKII